MQGLMQRWAVINAGVIIYYVRNLGFVQKVSYPGSKGRRRVRCGGQWGLYSGRATLPWQQPGMVLCVLI